VQDRTGGKESTPKGIYSEQLAQEDYGLLRTRVKNFCSSLTSLPINVIMTCGSVWIRDQHTGISRYAPQLAGKTAMEIPAYFDLVLFMESTPEGTRNGERSTTDFHCQGRIGRLGKHRVAQLDGDICEDFEGSMIL
jgi:hypothetical protein